MGRSCPDKEPAAAEGLRPAAAAGWGRAGAAFGEERTLGLSDSLVQDLRNTAAWVVYPLTC